MEHTLALIGRAHQGDKVARDNSIRRKCRTDLQCCKEICRKGCGHAEDLFQIGSIGLLKAVDKFDTSFEVKFSTYAVPMIIGEIQTLSQG